MESKCEAWSGGEGVADVVVAVVVGVVVGGGVVVM